MAWKKIADKGDVPTGGGKAFKIDGKQPQSVVLMHGNRVRSPAMEQLRNFGAFENS